MRKLLCALAVVAVLSGCSTVTIQPVPGVKVIETPSYQDTRHFFLWGLVGEEHVNVTNVCSDQGVAQMQSQATFVNAFLTIITFGIYAPHSVRVWCEDAELNEVTT